MIKHSIFTIGAVALCTTLSAITLHETTESAQTQRPLLKAQKQSIVQSEHVVSQARSGYFPHITAQYSTLFNQEYSTVDSSLHSISLSGTQLLFKANGPLFQANIATKGRQRAEHIFRAQTQKVQHDVVHAFLDAWLLQEKEPLIIALEKLSALTNERASLAHDNLHISIHERTLIEAQNAQHTATIDAYPHERRAARATLHTATGTGHSLTHAVLNYTYEVIPSLPTLQACIEKAHNNRPELKEKRVAIEQTQLSARAQRLDYLPSLNLHASYGRTFAGTSSKRGTNANLGITATWNIFDGMQRSHAAQAHDAAALRTRFELHELKNSITQQVSATYHAFKAAYSRLIAAEKMLDAQTGLHAQAEQRFSLGALDSVSRAQQHYEYERAAHAVREAAVAYRKQFETLNWHCGYTISPLLTGTQRHE